MKTGHVTCWYCLKKTPVLRGRCLHCNRLFQEHECRHCHTWCDTIVCPICGHWLCPHCGATRPPGKPFAGSIWVCTFCCHELGYLPPRRLQVQEDA
jgi:hypothetical protein